MPTLKVSDELCRGCGVTALDVSETNKDNDYIVRLTEDGYPDAHVHVSVSGFEMNMGFSQKGMDNRTLHSIKILKEHNRMEKSE